MKYRRKPEIVEAVEWTGENLKEVIALVPGAKIRVHAFERSDGSVAELLLIDGEGWTADAARGEWITKGREGVFVEDAEAFAEAFEPVEEDAGK